MSNSKRKALAGTGRGAVGKVAIAGMRERGGKVKATVVEHTDAATLVGLVESNVVPGTTVYTDEASAYGGLKRRFNHDSVKHSISEYVRGNVHTNGTESVWSILKRSIHGTWHHVSPKHLGKYVNEATFRLNEGNCEVDTIDRMESLAGQIGNKRLPYAKLVRPQRAVLHGGAGVSARGMSAPAIALPAPEVVIECRDNLEFIAPLRATRCSIVAGTTGAVRWNRA